MLAFTPYSEGGGYGKTTLAANLAAAEVRTGRDVLVIDLDAQQGSLSSLLGVDDDRDDPNTDNIVRHLVGSPEGEFRDLIRTTEEGIDVIPTHAMLSNLQKHLDTAEARAEQLNKEFDRYSQLKQRLVENDIYTDYDTIIVDVPGNKQEPLFTALVATQNVVLPFESTGKGEDSERGLEDLADWFTEMTGHEIGILAVVPNGYEETNSEQRKLAQLQESLDYPFPVTIRHRASMFNGCWDAECTAFHYATEVRERERDYELETLERIEELAQFLRQRVGDEPMEAHPDHSEVDA